MGVSAGSKTKHTAVSAEMSGWLIALTGCIYVAVACDLAAHGKHGLAIAYAGYAFANVGLWLAAK